MRRLAPSLLMLSLLGCAPSLRMVHQSNAYFERCHGADFDPTVSPRLRKQCWAQWLQHYTDGQPPDRVEYARNRVSALDDGEDIAPLPGMAMSAIGGSHTAAYLTTRSMGTPAGEAGTGEGGEFEPGQTLVQTSAATGRALEAPPRELPPPPETHGACTTVCTPRWNECMTRCEDGASACREACVTEHRTCMRGCY